MATTITHAFTIFRRNLEITTLQATTVSTRQQNVRAAVASKLTVRGSFLTGSYMRNTMIAPLTAADIDVFIVLDAQYYGKDGQAGLLDRVKRALKATYPKTPDISRDGQAVTIQFSDFEVDVVPAFNRNGGGYLIANSRGGTWIATDPREHVRLSSRANADHNGDLVPLIKMIKCWNRTLGGYFRSFHLEVLAWKILEGVRISDFPSGMRYFLDAGRTAIAGKNRDPAGYGGDVGYYISTPAQIDGAVSRFTTAYKRAAKACAYQQSGRPADALGEWRKVFGTTFPAYG